MQTPECVVIPLGHKPCTCGSKLKAKKCCFTGPKIKIINDARKEQEAQVVNAQRVTQRAKDAKRLFEAGIAAHEGDGVPINFGRAYELFEKAAALGSVKSLFNQAMLMEQQIPGVPHSVPGAVALYEKAVQLGSIAALGNLAILLKNGTFGVPQDAPRAVELYEKSIAAGGIGGTDSAFNLGYLLEKGAPGVPRDVPRAVNLYKKAIEEGQAPAMYNLGLLLEHGVEIEQNVPAAMYLYKEAASKGLIGAEASLRHLELEQLRAAGGDKMAIAKATRETAVALKATIAEGKCKGIEAELEWLNNSLSCDHCGKTKSDGVKKFSKCGGCLVARYCCTECSKAAYPAHKEECAKAKAEREGEGGASGSAPAKVGRMTDADMNAAVCVANGPQLAAVEAMSLSQATLSPAVGTAACDHCGKTADEAGVRKLKKCGKCLIARYCGGECASAAWKGHSKACSIVTAKRKKDAAERDADGKGAESVEKVA